MSRIALHLFALLLLTALPLLPLLAQADTTRADALYAAGKDLYYGGAYEKARRPLQQALTIRREWYGPEHAKVLEVLLRLGKNEAQLRNHPSAIGYLEEGLAAAEKAEGREREISADFLLELGHIHSQMYRPRQADDYYQQTMAIFEKIYGPESSEVGNMYMNFGISAVKMASYYEADRYFNQAYAVFQKSSEPTSKDFYRIYSNHGYLYRKMGNYDRAWEYATKALEIKLLHYPPGHPSVAKYHRNIGKIYQEQGAFRTALPYFQKTVDILEQALGNDHPETAGSYGELANVYADLGEHEAALRLYRRSVAVLEKELQPTHPYLVGGYFNIGRVYEDMGASDKALAYYQAALDRFRSGTYVPRHLIAQAQSRMAGVHFARGDVRRALLTLQEALQQIAPGFTYGENEIYPNPDLSQVQSDVDFLELLQAKSAYLQSLSTEANLEAALQTSLLAVRLIDRMWRGYQSEEARAFLNTRTTPIYRQAVRQAFTRYEQTGKPEYLWQAFELSEKNKAGLLRQNLNENYALETTGIPPAVLDTLRQMHRRITDLEEQRYDPATKETPRAGLQSRIFDLKRAYEAQVAGLEQHNPRYYQLKYQPAVTDPAELTRRLPDDRTVLIEYFCDSTDLYLFVLARTGLKGFRQPLDFDLREAIAGLREQTAATTAVSPGGTLSYPARLHQLYALLIDPIQAEITGKEKLIIVPAGPLHYLSFDLLAPAGSNTDFRRLDYLLKRYDLQYAWSAALWAQSPPGTQPPKQPFAGFAPGFDQNALAALTPTSADARSGQLAALTYTVPEVTGAGRYFDGLVLTGPAATERRFREEAPGARILHLATHAFADDRFPMQSGLLFAGEESGGEDGFLHAFEIYNLELQAGLAVISACDTGFGPLSEGEGVMSLGRAFTYAGCQSVVMSLWPANDRSTSLVFERFYHHLSQGRSTDEALRRAKLDYLQQADALTAHPYFWANLVAVGDMEAVTPESAFPAWAGWLTVMVVLTAAGMGWKRRRGRWVWD